MGGAELSSEGDGLYVGQCVSMSPCLKGGMDRRRRTLLVCLIAVFCNTASQLVNPASRLADALDLEAIAVGFCCQAIAYASLL